jgi:hypothetical protein
MHLFKLNRTQKRISDGCLTLLYPVNIMYESIKSNMPTSPLSTCRGRRVANGSPVNRISHGLPKNVISSSTQSLLAASAERRCNPILAGRLLVSRVVYIMSNQVCHHDVSMDGRGRRRWRMSRGVSFGLKLREAYDTGHENLILVYRESASLTRPPSYHPSDYSFTFLIIIINNGTQRTRKPSCSRTKGQATL